MPTPTYTLIDSTTLASSASSVTFSSITQDYRDLILVVEVSNVGGNTFANLQFNNDTGTNYSYVQGSGTGSATNSTSATGQTSTDGIGLALTGESGLWKYQIMDYSATDKHKSLVARFDSVGYRTVIYAARWANTSAITEIDILSFGTYPIGSTFYLFGIEA